MAHNSREQKMQMKKKRVRAYLMSLTKVTLVDQSDVTLLKLPCRVASQTGSPTVSYLGLRDRMLSR